ncbi:MAG: hypothetical protein ABIM18_08720 [candidate division WOR-3 bacterium]
MLIVLSVALICVSVLLEIYFAIKGPMLRLMNIVTLLYVYLLRPIVIILIGTSLLYPKDFDIDMYKMAWVMAAMSIVIENIGYYLTFPRINRIKIEFKARGIRDVDVPWNFSSVEKVVVWLIAFSFLFLSLMFITSGTAFLAQKRSIAMAAVNPMLRYLYPFVQLSAALLGFSGLVQIMFLGKKIRGVITFLLGVVFTAIVYQRGTMISFALLSLWILLDFFRIKQINTNKKELFKFFLIALFMFFILVFLRDFYNLIFSGFTLLPLRSMGEGGSILLLLVSRPDGDSLEVWTILLRYLLENGPLMGKSLLNIPYALASSNFRLFNELKLGVDILNEYYHYDTYWYRKFGFNLGSVQEMVLNFSFVGVFFAFFIGILRGALVRWYYRKLFFRGKLIKATIYYQGMSYFLSAFNAFHWMLFYAVFAEFLELVLKIRLKPKER